MASVTSSGRAPVVPDPPHKRSGAPEGAGAWRRSRRRDASRPAKGDLWLAVPALTWFALFSVGPLFAMFYYAFQEKDGFIYPASYVGTENFREVLADPLFWTAAKNTAIMLGVVLPIMIPTAFALGYYIALRPRYHNVLRTILFTPALISLSVRSMIFLALLSPKGALNGVVGAFGLEGRPWLSDSSTALAAIIAVDLWNGIGFTAVLFSARLSGVSSEVYEAAKIDGASHGRRTWQIAFPIVRDYVGVITMLQFLWLLFSSAGMILLLTRGGPGDATMTLSYLVYDKAFEQGEVGYSQAVGTLLFLTGITGLVLIRKAFSPSH